VEGLFNWLVGLPIAALYLSLTGFAALENFFPPVPADTIVGIGAFLAARGHGTLLGAFLATWIGNVGGAMVMYGLGRRFGAERLDRRLLGDNASGAQARIAAMYGKYGVGALVLSRFIPGVRAIVPPFCGALRVPPLRTFLAIGLASALWYGAIAYAGFTVGTDWHHLAGLVAEYGRVAAIVAAVVLVAGGVVWWMRRKRA
jgi:membrane protein DedA with SNARE-associated domain